MLLGITGFFTGFGNLCQNSPRRNVLVAYSASWTYVCTVLSSRALPSTTPPPKTFPYRCPAQVVVRNSPAAVLTRPAGVPPFFLTHGRTPFRAYTTRTIRGKKKQIVMYPIMNLRRYRQDIHWYLRALEETVIRTLAKLGLKGERVDGLTGVWVEERKVAVRERASLRGLAEGEGPGLMSPVLSPLVSSTNGHAPRYCGGGAVRTGAEEETSYSGVSCSRCRLLVVPAIASRLSRRKSTACS